MIGVVGPGATAAVEAAKSLRGRGVEPVRYWRVGHVEYRGIGRISPRAVALRRQGFRKARAARAVVGAAG